MRTRRDVHAALIMLCAVLWPAGAYAATSDSTVPKVAEHPKPASAETRVRGVYVESRFSAGYAVLSETIPADDAGTGTAGKSEALGGSIGAQLAVGYDIGKWIALEALGGLMLASGTRSDRVRDMRILYGGLGGRVTVPLTARLSYNGGVAAGYASSNNGVEDAKGGAWIQATSGLEYALFVHHFSVGCDATLLSTIAPARMFVALTPRLKYTF